MILADDVLAHLIGRLAEIYPKPATAKNIAARVAVVCGEWVTTEHLDQLAERIIETREAKTFPNVPSLLALVKAISRPAEGAGKPGARTKKTERIGGRDRSFPYGQHGANERERAYWEAEKRAYRFLRGTEIAAQAITERWATGLVDFAVREGREPDYEEERQIIALVRANDVDTRDFPDADDPIPVRARGPILPSIGHGLGNGIRSMRAAMHEAVARRLDEEPA